MENFRFINNLLILYLLDFYFILFIIKYDVLKEGQEKFVVNVINFFIFDLYKELVGNNNNVFFLFFSIEMVFVMVYEGVRGKIVEEMKRVLYFFEDDDVRWIGFRYFLFFLKSFEGLFFIFRSVNVFWVQRGYFLWEEYLGIVKEFYFGEVKEVDFQGNFVEVVREINEWVEEQMNGRIKDIVLGLSFLIRFVIMNVVYFKVNWLSRFRVSDMRNEIFYVFNGIVIVFMMYQIGEFFYFENDDFQVFEFFYEGERLGMLIILFKEGKFEKVEGNLSVGFIENILKNMCEEKVKVVFLKFRFEVLYKFRDVFMDMGMKRVFLVLDFFGIFNGENLVIEDVVYKSFISVVENGIEVVVVMVVMLMMNVFMQEKELKIFKVDYLFIFFIYDREIGIIFFMGCMMNLKDGQFIIFFFK